MVVYYFSNVMRTYFSMCIHTCMLDVCGFPQFSSSVSQRCVLTLVVNKWHVGVIDFDVLFVGSTSGCELFILAVIYDFVLLLSPGFLPSVIHFR